MRAVSSTRARLARCTSCASGYCAILEVAVIHGFHAAAGSASRGTCNHPAVQSEGPDAVSPRLPLLRLNRGEVGGEWRKDESAIAATLQRVGLPGCEIRLKPDPTPQRETRGRD
jgi:hypothetical protein